MNPDYDVTKRFLLWLYPNGPWTLTAISRTKKSIESDTFKSLDAAIQWVRDHESFNLYYSVNEPTPEAAKKKKFSKTDIARVHFLHVDVDPRPNTDIKAEQDRILTQLLGYRTQPSAIVFSGGGYNALWRLERPITLLADSAEDHIRNAVEVERRNWQFELDFNTIDHCRDVSRILRLPGTINRPSDEKIKNGRVPALSGIHWLYEQTYPYEHFMATPMAPVNASSSATQTKQDVKRIAHIDELELPDKVKAIIVQGYDPDKPGAEDGKSRSEWLFFICCEMVRANIPDDIILGVITDSNFGISSSVLDKGSRTMAYAIRQVTRAKDKAIHPRLMEMNDKFAVIENYGGKCVVMREEEIIDDNGEKRTIINFQSPFEFFNGRESSLIEGRNAKGQEIMMNDGRWWFKQPRRRQFSRVVFDPSTNIPGAYNTFKGFTVQPAEGKMHQRYLEHVYENICSKNDEHYQYLIKWMARVVQFPKTQSEVAVVLISKEKGTGKSFFCRKFLELFGHHGAVVDNMDHLIGRFNSHLSDKLLVIAEEAYHAYDRRNESVLKELITGKSRAVERKGYDVFWGANYVHLMMTSNSDRVVPAGDYERRFFVLKVSTNKMQDSDYFASIEADMVNGGYSHLMHELLSIDLKGYDVRKVPKTEALVDQQMKNFSKDVDWLVDKLHLGIWFTNNPKLRWEGPVIKSELYLDYVEYMRQRNSHYTMPHLQWARWMKTQLPSLTHKQLSDVHQTSESAVRPTAWVFPPLSYCRQEFLNGKGIDKFTWDDPLDVPEELQSPSLDELNLKDVQDINDPENPF